jgi:formaldehyde-activating enzyme involved in methanogenesis
VAKAIADAVEKEIIEAVLDESHRCVQVAHTCCSADLDKAHKIADGIKRTHTALAANLSALR